MTREEAIKVVKERLNYYESEKRLRAACELLIPELRESEDERIRKEIIEYFKHYSGGDNISVRFPKWIAYLEKQKAKERLDRMAPIYNDKESFEVGLEKAWKYYNESASRTVDSFEDDYIECVFSKGFREGFLYREKQKEQNHDDSIRTKIVSRAKSEKQVVLVSESDGNAEIGWDTRSLEDTKDLLEYGLAFISGQLGKQKEQKPAEWSEEDEKMIKIIDETLFKASVNTGLGTIRCPYDDARDWFKSLLERFNFKPHWKPSEEQMEALQCAIAFMEIRKASDYDLILLKELYEQLKKLGVKEEPEYYQHFDPDC